MKTKRKPGIVANKTRSQIFTEYPKNPRIYTEYPQDNMEEEISKVYKPREDKNGEKEKNDV